MRLVLDTNVVVSALLWRGAPYHLVSAIRDRSDSIALFASAPMLLELADVLSRPKVARKLSVIRRSAADLLADCASVVELVEPVPVPRIAPDPDDDVVIATAVAAQAHLIITGDRRLLALDRHDGVPIITVAAAMDRIAGAVR